MTGHDRADAGDLARRLAEQAEAVCRYYLSAGRRHGKYWLVGDVRNTPGRSMYVRLHGPSEGRGAAGRWADAASGEYGDLLDVIRESCGLLDFHDVADEARAFLNLPVPEPRSATPVDHPAIERGPAAYAEAARRLWSMTRPLAGTLAATYLRHRDLKQLTGVTALRFHPTCYYRPDDDGSMETWPALIAAVTDFNGTLTGVHRTWLAADGRGKAPVDVPRRALGDLLGHAVRFGVASDVLAAGEGIETVLSLRQMLPDLPLAACLSAGHLAAMVFPPLLRRLYVVRDDDPAGDHALETLVGRARDAGIDLIALSPRLADFNDDLRHLGPAALRAILHPQLAPQDVARFLETAHV
jgi:Toprim domain